MTGLGINKSDLEALEQKMRGITWSHRRGYSPLDAAAVRQGDVSWDRHSLSGFESTPIQVLAQNYDLVVLDHPGLGAATDALWPLDEMMPREEIDQWSERFVGSSTASYELGGHQWAVPIDAAAQVFAAAPDVPPLANWQGVDSLVRDARVAVPLRSPHALLTFLGICAAIDNSPSSEDELVSAEAGQLAWDVLRVLAEAAPKETRGRDPIELLDMIGAGELDCSPLVFSYINYVNGSSNRRVRFSDAPCFGDGGVPGSVLGGTGLAISQHVTDPVTALAILRDLSSVHTQSGEYLESGGQPAAVAAWTDPSLDRAHGGFFSGTLQTQLSAWRRPRFDGWISVQTAGSDLITEALAAGKPPLNALNDLYRQERSAGLERASRTQYSAARRTDALASPMTAAREPS